MFDDGSTDPFGPDGQLFRGCGPEGIAGSQHDRFPLFFIEFGKLADGRRLADAVDADDEDDPRPVRFRHGFVVFIQQLDDAPFEIGNDVITVFDLPVFDAGPDLVEKVFRRFDADVTGQHDGFQVVIHVVVDFRVAADDGFYILNE